MVEKKTGFDGSRTLIQGGFCAWCSAGSIFAQDIEQSYNLEKKVTKVKSPGKSFRLVASHAQNADRYRLPVTLNVAFIDREFHD